MLEHIGDLLPVYEQYEQMFADSPSFRQALANMYFDIILFLCRAKDTFRSFGKSKKPLYFGPC
jgi:hypothetical protein